MQTKTIFKIQAVIFLINALGQLFATEMFFEMAEMEITPSLTALGQFMGSTFIFLSLVLWKTSEMEESAVKKFGSIWAIGSLIWTATIAYHVYLGLAGGATAYVNMGIFAVFAVLYYTTSRK
jgi:hypothetical protein